MDAGKILKAVAFLPCQDFGTLNLDMGTQVIINKNDVPVLKSSSALILGAQLGSIQVLSTVTGVCWFLAQY